MNDKSWAFFGLTVLQIVLGFWAGLASNYNVAAVMGFGSLFSFIAAWCMTAY